MASVSGYLPADAKPYLYNDIQDNEIRLLRLHPLQHSQTIADKLYGTLETWTLTADYDTSIEGHLLQNETDPSSQSERTHTALPERFPPAPEYEALSYTWGSKVSLAVKGRAFEWLYLEVNPAHGERGKPTYQFLNIAPNLVAALRRFRQKIKPNEELRLWVDAVCINQASKREKGDQIRKMSTIYAEAEQVRIWLGDQDGDTDAAFSFISRILSFDDFDTIVKEPLRAYEWNALRSLMQREWFSRRWIVQEVAFARRSTVHCGDKVISWDDFKGAILLFADVAEQLRKTFRQAESYDNNPDYLGEIKAWGATTLVEAIDLMFRRSGEHVVEYLLSLESLITTLTPFDAKLPHDCVYAIIRLSKDARPAPASSDRQALPRTETNAAGQPIPTLEVDDTSRVEQNSNVESKDGQVTEHNTTMNGTSPSDEDARGRSRQRSASFLSTGGLRHRSKSPAFARAEAEREFVPPPKHFRVDYERSLTSLCSEIIRHAADRSQSIDIICKPWVPDPKEVEDENYKIHEEDKKAMPSWMRSLNERPYSVDPDQVSEEARRARSPSTDTYNKISDGTDVDEEAKIERYSRVAADPLVGTSLKGDKTYKACGDVPRKIHPDFGLIKDRCLYANGFVLARIGEAANPAPGAVIPGGWLAFGGWPKQDVAPPPEFWRTLVADRESSSGPRKPPEYWPYACKWAFQQIPSKGKDRILNPQELITNVRAKPAQHVMSFLHRVREVVWGRRLIKTEELVNGTNLLGLAPVDAIKGDLICILHGCSVPVILREKRPRDRSPTPRPNKTRAAQRRALSSQLRPVRSPPPQSSNSSAVSTSAIVETNRFTTEPTSYQAEENATASGSTHTPKTLEPPSQTYSLIGECFLYGMMDGEAFQEQRARKLKDQFFAIGCTEECDCEICEKFFIRTGGVNLLD